jgi:catechol 2,3-dioxygenase-like lactoylglutathione lyase family enzyme
MLNDKEAIVTIPVKQLDVARRFYEGVLGWQPAPDQMGALKYQSAGAKIFVYESRYAGTNQATAVTWIVGQDLERIVEELGAKGVRFEHYDNLPETRLEGDIHVSGDHKIAWFKDPDGNIHSLS